MKNSISLIGMAGSGKTTIGLKLSEILNLSFSDSDNVIETKYGKTLQSILDSDGYMGLRAIEENAILSIKIDHVVLATGGSAVYSTKAMEYLKMNSLIIFLEVPFDQIMERVAHRFFSLSRIFFFVKARDSFAVVHLVLEVRVRGREA